MKKFFVLLFGLVILILIGGCQSLIGFSPFLNRAPIIISEPIITATEDQLYSYQVEAKDPDGDSITYLLTLSPGGMSIDSENGLITWTPTNDQAGINLVEVEISDGKKSDTQSFEIEVINVNNPPQIFSYFPGSLNVVVDEGESKKFEVQANDMDSETTFSFRWFLNGKLVSSTTSSGNDSKSSWTYSASYGDYSQKIVKILVSDGELQDYVQWNITINDTTPPDQPTLGAVTSPTNISPQTLSGTKEPNTSIWINEVEVIPVNSSTTWTYDFNLSEGENNISITSRDIAGNVSLSVTTNIILDVISPMVPTLNSIISPTNISTQILGGGKEVNTSVLINGSEVIPINSEATWSYSLHLTEGTNSIFVTSCDSAGNESSAVSTIIVLDISAPVAPTLNDVTSPTNISTQILTGTKEANSSIWINGTEVISINSDTTWLYSFDLFEGNNNISITSRDTSGNESAVVTSDIALDTISPEALTLDAVTSLTNISPQTLSGTKESNTSIWINEVEVIPVNSDTTWSYSYNFSEGNNNISITSRDAIGNESAAITAIIEYDPNIYVDEVNATGTEDGTQTYPFDTITEGIAAVASGKSVVVFAGTYNEQLIINKEITLQGAGKESSTISGLGYTGENLITVTADDVTISGFTIDGDSSTSVGIYFDNLFFITINNNLIKNNKDYGISYINSTPIIEGNNIENNSSSGIKVATNGAGIIRNNSLINNLHGIRSCEDSCPEITGNNISNNNTGIYCRESATPIISYNTISNNTGYGILIDNNFGNLVNPDIGGGDGQSDGQNKITGNIIHGVSNETTHNIYAKYNWWGDAAGPKYPYHVSSIGDWAFWSKTGGEIIFEPYLTTEP